MRVVVLVMATDDREKGFLPMPGPKEAMGRFDDELRKAGILRVADDLTPAPHGKRITYVTLDSVMPSPGAFR